MDVTGKLFALAVVFLMFRVIRAILCWYWRVNEGLALPKSINEKLRQLANEPG